MKKNIISLVAVCLLGALFTVMAGHTDSFGEQGRTAHSFYDV